jgi:hypothetical protein
VWLRKNKKDRTVPLELLYALQKARIKRRFDKLANDLQKKARWCHHYFFKRKELRVESWAHYAFLEEGLSTYGHKTSNIVESMNGVWKPFRALHPYWLLDATVEWCHEKYAERYNGAKEREQKVHLFTKYAQGLINKQRELARNRKYQVSKGENVYYCTNETKRNGTCYAASLMCSRILSTSKDMFFCAGKLCYGSLLYVCEGLQAALPSCLGRRAEESHAGQP